MNIIGISCFYHDSAACLLQDGKITAAAQEERFSRKKYDSSFPIEAINYCLKEGNVTIDEIDVISFYEKPYLKFSRVIMDHIMNYPFSFRNFRETMPLWLKERLILPEILKKEIGYENEIF